MTTCPKCRYTRQQADTSPDYECPKCGVVYAKVSRQRKAVAARPHRGKSSAGVVIAVLLAATLGGLAWGTQAWMQRQAQLEAKKQLEIAAERRHREIEQGVAALKAIEDKWDDALDLARSTPRISLSGPVGNMQALVREAGSLALHECLAPAKELLLKSMSLELERLLLFMRSIERDSAESIREARMATAGYLVAKNRCLTSQ